MPERNNNELPTNLDHKFNESISAEKQLTGLFDVVFAHGVHECQVEDVQKLAGSYVDAIVKTGNPESVYYAKGCLRALDIELSSLNLKGEKAKNHTTYASGEPKYEKIIVGDLSSIIDNKRSSTNDNIRDEVA